MKEFLLFLEDHQYWADQAMADPEIRRRVEFLEHLSWESDDPETPEQREKRDGAELKEKAGPQAKAV